MSGRKSIALPVDCENASHHAIEGVREELARCGVDNVRHAHGDWNSASLSGWQQKLHPHAIRPLQHFAYTKGRNATDSAMISDAMDLLYGGSVDAFAPITSDSDFTPLAMRILQSGIPVYGFGEKNTPGLRRRLLSVFIHGKSASRPRESGQSPGPVEKEEPQRSAPGHGAGTIAAHRRRAIVRR